MQFFHLIFTQLMGSNISGPSIFCHKVVFILKYTYYVKERIKILFLTFKSDCPTWRRFLNPLTTTWLIPLQLCLPTIFHGYRKSLCIRPNQLRDATTLFMTECLWYTQGCRKSLTALYAANITNVLGPKLILVTS